MNKMHEIRGIDIKEGEYSFYGPDQNWYKRKLHSMSGCGPTTAAIAMAHFSQSTAGCSGLYPYKSPFLKDDFMEHMEEVRLFVKPGFWALTDANVFGERSVAYAKTKSVNMSYKIVDKSQDSQNAFEQVTQLIDKNIMPSLLILRNPHKEINEFTWHWMSITGYFRDSDEILISTYGKKYRLDFAKVWQQKKPFSTDIVFFFA